MCVCVCVWGGEGGGAGGRGGRGGEGHKFMGVDCRTLTYKPKETTVSCDYP